MNANELRIGNYVNARLDKSFVFTKIDGILVTNEVFVTVDGDMHVKRKLDYDKELEPIPLTKGWLVKFDLKEAHHSACRNLRYELPGYGYEIHLSDDTDHGVYFEGNCMTYIKYVHQLQNLVFALTGEELTTK